MGYYLFRNLRAHLYDPLLSLLYNLVHFLLFFAQIFKRNIVFLKIVNNLLLALRGLDLLKKGSDIVLEHYDFRNLFLKVFTLFWRFLWGEGDRWFFAATISQSFKPAVFGISRILIVVHICYYSNI